MLNSKLLIKFAFCNAKRVIMAETRRYPLGIQTFTEIREGDYVYIDKTEYVYRIASTYKYVFLSRPRRFGKSLLASTFQCYFEGRRELFEGLAAAKMEKDWTRHPVLHFDMSKMVECTRERFLIMISEQLSQYEEIYGKNTDSKYPGDRLDSLIRNSFKQTGEKAVVIIDEYDAPVLNVAHDAERLKEMRNVVADFYAPLKSCDPYLRFVFITGITKFAQLSIFSQLNNLSNITMVDEFSPICGITEEELLTELQPGIKSIAEKNGMTYDAALAKLKHFYDGYHFSGESPDMYNPFSLMSALNFRNFDFYWFSTGTPSFLINQLRRFQPDLTQLAREDRELKSTSFDVSLEEMRSIEPLLYQSGYLTIKSYNPDGFYTLGFPNQEVRIGLLESLIPYYLSGDTSESDTFVYRMYKAFRDDDVEGLMDLITSYFASITYDLENKSERHFQTILYIMFSLVSQYGSVEAEVKSAVGRADIVIKTRTTIFVMELKVDGTAEDALAQINSRGYSIKYIADGRKITKIGINFSSKTRTVEGWKAE